MRNFMFVMALSAVAAFAQIGTSTITGRVTDTSSAVVPNVKVTIIQKSTNFNYAATTNNDGLFRVPSLQPGQYSVSFEAAGFKKTLRDDVELRTGDTLAVDASMQVGQISESVEVTGTAQLLQTETSSTGTVMSGNVLYELPLYQRYVNATLNLVPGMSSGGFAYGGDLGSYHLAGQRNGSIGIFEDGVNGNDQQGGTGTIKPLQNSVAEVNVMTTVPPAEYGHSAGGVISVVKKSGSNELHGMGSFFGRTRMMQHRRYFDLKRTSDAYPGRPNGLPVFFMQPDANISGPLVIPHLYNGKNKTFFFFGYQRLHEKKVAQVFTSTPTPEMLGGDFNFPGVTANQIFDPATTRNVNGTWLRDPFAGNRVPLSRFDPVAAKVLSFNPWVLPNNTTSNSFTSTGPSNNVLANEFARTFFDDYNLRMDHQFSSAFKIYGSFTENNQSGFNRPILFNQNALAFDSSQGIYTPFRQNNTSLGYTWLPGSSIVNDSRVGFFRRRNDTSVPSFGEGWPSKLGIPNADNALMPAFNIYGINGATPSKQVNETVSYRNDTTWVKGSHAFKFGYELLHFRLNSANFARFSNFAFDGVTSGLAANGSSVANTGITFAGFLTGYVRQATFNAEITSWLPRSSIHSFYFQDDWKISPTLTANLGVRYSNESPFRTKYGSMSSFDPTGTDTLTGLKGAIIHPGNIQKRDNNNFNPRLGLAWHAMPKMVFRGGLGFNTVDTKFPQNRGQFDEYTASATQQALPGDPTPIYRISRGPDPVNFVYRKDGTSPFLGTNYSSRGVSWWDNNLHNAYVINFNGSAQYEFRRNYLLELSYQGSSGVGLHENWMYNSFPIDFAAGNPVLQNQVFAASQNYRPFPNYGDIRIRGNFGHSTFHSGTVKVEKRMSEGLFFQTFYTLAKAIDSQDNNNDGTGLAPLQNRSLEKARASFDRKHRFVGVANYELPFGAGKKWANNGIAKWILGGFEVSWIETHESGNPITFTYTGSPYNYYPGFAGQGRPDITGPISIRDNWYDLGGARFSSSTINSVFSGEQNGLSNFSLPGGCAYTATPTAADRARCDFKVGNAGRNTIDGLPLRWSQASAQKNFVFKEKYRAQLRWDMQNIFKRYNFNTPTTAADFRPANIAQFGKVSSDPTTASLGGQPLMNLTLMVQF